MPSITGRTIPLSVPRRFVVDLMHFARQVPTVPVQRRMQLGTILRARQAAEPRPSWVSIFTKAFALVAVRWPELRRAYLSFPLPRLYEHPVSIATIAVERQFGDDHGVFFGKIRSPENRGLPEIDERLRALKENPIEKIGAFRHALFFSRLPWPIRRLLWWIGLSVWGRKRAAYFGTFGVSVYAGLGAASLHPLSPATCTLNYGVIDERGEVDVRITYDHRVLDGATVARVLADLEQVLNGAIVNELGYLRAVDAA
jgi:hypothetical protein